MYNILKSAIFGSAIEILCEINGKEDIKELDPECTHLTINRANFNTGGVKLSSKIRGIVIVHLDDKKFLSCTPIYLESLVIEDSVSQIEINFNYLPYTLKYLKLGDIYINKFEFSKIPKSIEELEINCPIPITDKDLNGYINLVKLSLPHCGIITLACIKYLSPDITHINFNSIVHKQHKLLDAPDFMNEVSAIIVGDEYIKKDVSPIIFPSKLKVLKVKNINLNDYEFNFETLPQTLEVLDITNTPQYDLKHVVYLKQLNVGNFNECNTIPIHIEKFVIKNGNISIVQFLHICYRSTELEIHNLSESILEDYIIRLLLSEKNLSIKILAFDNIDHIKKYTKALKIKGITLKLLHDYISL